MKILVALYMKFICPAVAQPPYSTWDKVILLEASTTYALKQKSSSKYKFLKKVFYSIESFIFFQNKLVLGGSNLIVGWYGSPGLMGTCGSGGT